LGAPPFARKRVDAFSSWRGHLARVGFVAAACPKFPKGILQARLILLVTRHLSPVTDFPMSLRHIAAALAAALAIALIAASWLESRADRAQLQSTLAAQQQLIAAAGSREQTSTAALKSALDEIAALKRQVQTSEQVIASLPQYLPLPQPIALAPTTRDATGPPPQSAITNSSELQQGIAPEKGTALPAATGTSTERIASALPDSPAPRPSPPTVFADLKSEISRLKSPSTGSAPPSISQPSSSSGPQSPCRGTATPASALIPDADLKPLYDYVQDCRACQAQLAAAAASLKDEQARSVALTRERDAAVTAAKGGSFWRQLKTNAKWLTIGAAAGLLLSRTR
jgi:hypothetical protein